VDTTHRQDLLDRQRELEENAIALGGARFRKSIESAEARGEASLVGAARYLLSRAIEPVQTGVEEFLIAPTTGRKHIAFRWCQMLGADVAAYITVKAVMDSFVERRAYRKLAESIASRFGDEMRYREFRAKAPGLFDYAVSKFQTSNYSHKARSLNGWLNHAVCSACRKAERTECSHIETFDLSDAHRLLVGGKMLDIMAETTGLVEIEHETVPRVSNRSRPKTELYVVPSPAAEELLNKRNEMLEFLTPYTMPMVVPPLPWSRHEPGGYRYALRGRFGLVRGISKEAKQRIRNAEMPVVYSALNRIQSTAWRVNSHVLEVAEAIKASGRAIAGLAAFEKEPLPVKPDDIDENEEARNAYRRQSREVHERNVIRRREAREVDCILNAARAVATEEAIYFPHNVDFRGRIYPIATALHPQGRDLAKALLTFAYGKPLGETGAAWLAIHGANCLGETPQGQKVSRMTMQERADWIQSHTQEICDVVARPFDNLWWSRADDPLQFFAFCVEWAAFARLHNAGHGEEYVCSLPISQDGSCNGLQHFAALFRDRVGGSAVNLCPNDRPADIYERIARQVLDSLSEVAADQPLAAKWLASGLVTRKLCKRPTMTFVYGSRRFGFREQLSDYLKHDLERSEYLRVRELFTDGTTNELKPACDLMSEHIWNALRVCAIAAFDGMAWMQKCAGVIARNGHAVEWQVTPTGFPVRQEYFDVQRHQVKTVLCGSVVQPSFYTATDVVSQHEQRNGVAPNIVHSLDAAALMLTVALAGAQGIEHFAMIHDSYGTLAADCSLLARCTRQAFVGMYSQHDIVGDLYAQFGAQVPDEERDEIPAPPSRGDLDIGAVLASTYFFC